jgi:hypothetical protein
MGQRRYFSIISIRSGFALGIPQKNKGLRFFLKCVILKLFVSGFSSVQETFMPLSFRSENHGSVAFGFFNIESDMLLLENHFFFADMFCKWMGQLAETVDIESRTFERAVYYIENPRDVGDLMGAIHGVSFTGFIGDVYQMFPFPREANAFKQNPEGFLTQKVVTSCILSRSVRQTLSISFHRDDTVHFGPYRFHQKVFQALILYVWEGGYPCWKDEVRPRYVMEMKNRIENTGNPFFKGVFDL